MEAGTGALNGAQPRDRGFFGVEVGGETVWLLDERFDLGMHAETGTGLLTISYEPTGDAPVTATEVLSVQPGTETVVQDLTVENAGDRPVEGVTYYMQADANARQQYPPGITSHNSVWTTDRAVRWADHESDVGLELAAVDGEHRFAALGWANAGFVHAVHVRQGLAGPARN